jgi:hypothetical protein
MIILVLTSTAQKLDTTSLKELLSKQGFSGVLQGKVNFTVLGDMECGSTTVRVYYYTWEETKPAGRAIHFNQRLIFVNNRTYLGNYVISDRPVLTKPNVLRFPVSQEDGNSFNCDQDGLPKSVYLDGGDRVLSK